jgi:molybdopterin-guanine dinucleotide biosynthesis protein A
MPATATDAGWTGVVLAGGRSSRMGRDKAGLLWHGKPLLHHMADLLREAGAARVAVSGDYPEMDGIPDTERDLGPLGGIASVAAALPDGPLLIVPVDMPAITAPLLATLVGSDARCACYRDHMLPLRLQLDARLRDWLPEALRQPPSRRSLRALHAAQDGIFLPLPEHAATQLDNLNTPEQWQEAVR